MYVLRLSSPDCLAKLTVQQSQNVHSHSILSIIPISDLLVV